MANSVTEETWGNYGASLLRFTQFCDAYSVLESLHVLASEPLLALFVSEMGAGKVQPLKIDTSQPILIKLNYSHVPSEEAIVVLVTEIWFIGESVSWKLSERSCNGGTSSAAGNYLESISGLTGKA
ncbi:hypothetical protein ARMGADRAFT_1035312 [Armillaria gallica]|uniref:Uncharacterized protein n=1 Tax=Armillaria gallica TaxID=47427 RepID=A0A2H3CUR2_ARMGA|nr:hypothetical protein ARMGADRAFT_1035312 [Armillaria gallica]